MLSEGHAKRSLPLERIAALTATNAARAMGVADRKGAIALEPLKVERRLFDL